jgi:hypothetical protein
MASQDQHIVHRDRYVPARTNEGWGAAAATVLLALILVSAATVIHKRTYKPPTDPSWRAAGQQPAAQPPRGH